MGMTINESIRELEKARDSIEPCLFMDEAIDQSMKTAISTMRKYQQLRADYENRLKADMVAMLDELDLELYEQYEDTDLVKVKYIRQSIQQKIDKLKGEQGNAVSD